VSAGQACHGKEAASLDGGKWDSGCSSGQGREGGCEGGSPHGEGSLVVSPCERWAGLTRASSASLDGGGKKNGGQWDIRCRGCSIEPMTCCRLELREGEKEKPKATIIPLDHAPYLGKISFETQHVSYNLFVE